MKWFNLLCCILITCPAIAQDRTLEQVMEDHARQDDNREADEDLIQMAQYKQRPLNINLAKAEDFSGFPFLTAQHIEQLLIYRSILGPLHHIMELQAVPGWEPELIRKILPYVYAGSILNLRKRITEDLKDGQQMLLFRTAPGRNAGFLARYSFQSASLRFGVTMDKDRGERLFQRGKGISFLSAHLSYRGSGLLQYVVVGDHLVNIGQGLLLWQGRGMRKTGMSTMVKRQLPMLQEYRSVDENRFMRGIGMSLRKRNFGLNVFMNINRVDGNVRPDSSGRSELTSFLYTGLHRTESELADKDAVKVISTGASLFYQRNRLKISLNTVRHAFSIPMEQGKEPYELFSHSAKRMEGQSISYHYTWRNAHFFGEVARGARGNALLQGIMVAADKRLDLALVARKIGRDYRAFGASAFTEAVEVNNEEGVYVGLTFRPGQNLSMELYADHFRSPWLRYRLNRPSYGRDHLAQLTWRPDKKTMMLVRWKMENKMNNQGEILTIRKVLPGQREALRFHVEHQVNPRIEIRSRLEWSWVRSSEPQKYRGFLMYADIFLRSGKLPVSGNARVMVYQASSYEARIYAYENDVMYFNYIPSFYDSGFLTYVNVRFQMTEALNLYIKYSLRREAGVFLSNSRLQIIFSF